jgi:uncharacterized protein (DUF952 family)
MTTIYKIADAAEWRAAHATGIYHGSPDDQRDGYIHFSTGAQLPGTAQKHFAGRKGLLLIAVDAGQLGEALKWEAARDGELFPHLYAPLPVTAAIWFTPLILRADGSHDLPEGLP